MNWNYRIIKLDTLDGSDLYTVAEVFYSKAGRPELFSDELNLLISDSLRGLDKILGDLRASLAKPVILESSFSKARQGVEECRDQKGGKRRAAGSAGRTAKTSALKGASAHKKKGQVVGPRAVVGVGCTSVVADK